MVVEVQKVPSGPSKGRSTGKARRPDYALGMAVWGTFWKVLLVVARPHLGYYVCCWRLLWSLRVAHWIYSIPAVFVLEVGSNSVTSFACFHVLL